MQTGTAISCRTVLVTIGCNDKMGIAGPSDDIADAFLEAGLGILKSGDESK